MAVTHVFVPSLGGAKSSATTQAQAYSSAVSADDVLWCFVWQQSSTNACSGVVDTVNAGGWTQAFGPVRGGGGGATIYGFYRLASAAGTPTVTATWSAAAVGGMLIGAVRGLAGGGALDQAPSASLTGPSSDSWALSTTTLAQAIEAGVGFITASTLGTGVARWTVDRNVDAQYYERSQTIITSSTAATTFGFTGGTLGGAAAAAGVMMFKDFAAALVFTGTVGAQSGTTGTAFSWAGAALSTFFSGGTSPYTYSVVSGTLPAGLSLNSSTGVVSGTPTAAGSGSVTFRVTDAASGTVNSNSVAFTIAAAPATATTLTGPSGGQVGVASSNFTVGANGAITGTITITPSAGGGGGTFSPTSVTISAGSPTATFTYTPASAGAKTISIADDGGLTDAASLTYTASTTPGRMLFNGANDEFRNNAGTLLASKAVTLHFHHATTGALIVQVDTTTDSSGLVGTISNASLALSTNYRVDYKFSTGEYGVVYRTTEAT